MSTSTTGTEIRRGDRVEVEGHVLGGSSRAPGGPGTVVEVFRPGHSSRRVALVRLDAGDSHGRLVDLELVSVVHRPAGGQA